MGILWKPTGSLDINTTPTDLPEQSNGNGILSGAMARCKNLRLNQTGKAVTRYGSSVLKSMSFDEAPSLILEVGGHRYIFAGSDIYYDEVGINAASQCYAPTFAPAGNAYADTQSVVITSETLAAEIFYTLDGTTPTVSSNKYVSAVLVPTSTYLKAIAIDPRGYLYDSDVTTAYYSIYTQNAFISETDLSSLITETDSNALTTEGP